MLRLAPSVIPDMLVPSPIRFEDEPASIAPWMSLRSAPSCMELPATMVLVIRGAALPPDATAMPPPTPVSSPSQSAVLAVIVALMMVMAPDDA